MIFGCVNCGGNVQNQVFCNVKPPKWIENTFLPAYINVSDQALAHTQRKKNVVMNIHKGYKCSLYKHGNFFQLVTFLDGFEKKYTLVWNVLEWEKSLRLLKFEINSTKCLFFGLFFTKIVKHFHVAGPWNTHSWSRRMIQFVRCCHHFRSTIRKEQGMARPRRPVEPPCWTWHRSCHHCHHMT